MEIVNLKWKKSFLKTSLETYDFSFDEVDLRSMMRIYAQAEGSNKLLALAKLSLADTNKMSDENYIYNGD